MAATRKKSAGKRKTPAPKKKKQVQTGPSMESEILLWIVLAVSVVLLISKMCIRDRDQASDLANRQKVYWIPCFLVEQNPLLLMQTPLEC